MVDGKLHINSTPIHRHGLPILGYLGLTIVTTWPVLPRFMTHIPGGGDAPWFLWQLWWFKHALLNLRQSPFVTDLIYHPLTDVPVTVQTPINEFFTLPLQIAVGVVPLYNLLFLLSYIFSGYFTYLLGLLLVKRRDLAFLGGVIFAFCAYRGMRGLGHLSLLTTQWMPLALLCAILCWRRPSWQRGVATGVAAALVALSSPYYLGVFLFPVLTVGLIYLLCWRYHQLRWHALVQAGIMAGGIFVLMVGPFYLPLLFVAPEIYAVNQRLAEFIWQYSADLLSWAVPAGLHPLWGRYTAPIYNRFTTPNLMETTVYLGMIPLLLACMTIIVGRSVRSRGFWQLLAITTAVLALGPALHVYGQEIVRGLPYQWLLQLPGFDAFRVPSRAGVTTALAVSILTIIALQQLSQQFSATQWRLIWPLLTLLILIDITPVFPYPTSPIAIPTPYTTIAESTEQSALLELPAGEFYHSQLHFLDEVSWYMYYQTYHQTPIVSGYLGRRPLRLTDVERNLPFARLFLQDLDERRLFDPALIKMMPDPFWPDEIRRGQEHLAQQKIGHVLLRCSTRWPTYCPQARTLLQQGLGRPQQDDSFMYYQVQQPSYTTDYVPAYLITPPLSFEPAFSDAEIDITGRRRALQQQSGVIRFTIPFDGFWQIAGNITGTQTKTLAFHLDGVPVMPILDATTDGMTIAWEQQLQSGLHELQISLPPETLLTNLNCEELCLHNVHVKLINPLPAATAPPVATFVDESGSALELLATKLFTVPATTAAPTTKPQLLMNVWRLDDNSYRILQDDPMRMPVNFVHFTDDAGNTLLQADHPLGVRRLLVPDAKILFDLVALPQTDSVTQPTELRMGLWYPQTEQYFWSPDAAAIDPVGRVKVGRLTDFAQTSPVPTLPTNGLFSITFENPADGRSLHLLDAYITVDSVDQEQYQLATIWEQPDLFIAPVSVTLFAHLTDQNGELLQSTEHVLNSYQLTWHNSGLLYDRLDLPKNLAEEVHEVRIGLWYPDREQYYKADKTDSVDNVGRLRLGTLTALQRAQ